MCSFWGGLGPLFRYFFVFFRSWALLGHNLRSKSRLEAIFNDLGSNFGGFAKVLGGFREGFGGVGGVKIRVYTHFFLLTVFVSQPTC